MTSYRKGKRNRFTLIGVLLLSVMLLSSCSPTDVLAFLAGCKNGTTAASGSDGSNVQASFDKAHYTPPKANPNPLIERAVRWAEATALDDSHGYSQARRNSLVDFDCSSLVWFAYKQAGLPLGDGWPFTTWTMGGILKALGFQEFTWSGNPTDAASKLQRGDVLVDPVEHTEMSAGGGLFVGARHACPGGIEDGRSGDQCTTGNEEIGIGPAYQTRMTMVYRYTGGDKPANSPTTPNKPTTGSTVSAAWTCQTTDNGNEVINASYTGNGVHASPADAKGIARQQLKNGYKQWDNDSEFQCLVWVWDRESGWRWNATNPSSGAYGIPQALPADKLATAGSDWKDNAGTQISWGLNYIRDRYGSPCGAQSFWRAHNWY